MSRKIVSTIAAGLLIASVAMSGYASCKGKTIEIKNKSTTDKHVIFTMDEGYEKYLDEPIDIALKKSKSAKPGKFLGPKSSSNKGYYTITIMKDGKKSCEYKGYVSNDWMGVCVNKAKSNSCTTPWHDMYVNSWGNANFQVNIGGDPLGH